MSEVTRILSQIESGDRHAAEQLLPLVYEELKKLAAAKLRHEQPGQTLQTTALVHEAYVRLVASPGRESGETPQFNGRQHFFAVAAEAMRHILVDKARRKRRAKHGGGWHRVELDDKIASPPTEPDELLALDESLDRLAVEDPEAAMVVKLRYFAGQSVEEAAETLGISRATAYRHWTFARAWLLNELSDSQPE